MAIKFLNTATAATQAVGDNSTKIATTAYVDAAASAIPIGNYLPLAGGTMNTNAAITMSGSLTTSANVYAQRFYDQGDNAFYGDFAGTSQFNHVKINSVLGTQSFVSGSYGWQLEQSTTTADPVTFRFDNQKYRVYAGGGAGEIMTFLEGGNVGIGATAPAAKLHVVGKQMITTGANASPQTEDYLFIGGDGLSSANASIYIGNRGDGTGYGWRMLYEGVGSGVNNKLKFRSENLGSPVDVITMTQDGNVGIGVTSPSEKLQIYEGGLVAYKSYTATGAGAILTGYQSTTSPYTKTTDLVAGSDGTVPSEIRFLTRTNGTATVDERMRIDSAGNVGIGTTPFASSLNNTVLDLAPVASVWGYANSAYLNANAYYNSGWLYKSTAAAGVLQIDGNSLTFRQAASGTANAGIAFDQPFVINASGNVGIGTTAPAARLHVKEPSGNTSQIKMSAASNEANYGYLTMLDNTVNTAKLTFGTTYGYNTPVDAMTIFNGNVGIGTPSPSQSNLVVSPSAQSADVDGVTVVYNPDGATNRVRAQLKIDSFQGILELTNSGDVTSTYITANGNSYLNGGNVGIGTDSPDQKLHIKGGDIQTQDTTGSNGVLRIRSTITGTPSTGGYPNVGTGDAVIEGGGTTQRQPGVITLMNGDSSISSGQDLGVIQFLGKDDQTNGYCTSQIISTTSSTMGTGASGGGILRFLTSSGSTGAAVEERMRINNSGRVMIGTTTSTSNANLTVKESLAIQSGSNTVLSIFTGYGSSFINTGTSGGTVRFGAPTSYTTNVYVQGTIEAVSSVQMGNNTAAASSANAGSTRYRVSGNNSYMDMSMRTGATTYAWVNIVQNNW